MLNELHNYYKEIYLSRNYSYCSDTLYFSSFLIDLFCLTIWRSLSCRTRRCRPGSYPGNSCYSYTKFEVLIVSVDWLAVTLGVNTTV